MAQIATAIDIESLDMYNDLMKKVGDFTERYHIDISDGEFAPTFLVDEKDIWWPPERQADVHAMVARPSEHIQTLIAKKPNMIIFHAEVEEDLLPIFNLMKQAGIKTGLALQRSTVPADVHLLMETVDHVMIFTGELGHYGGIASMMQLEKVRLIKAIRPNIEIGWDGGVTIDNAFTLAQGGVDVLNVGSTIAKSTDPAATYAKLVNEINKHGVI